MVFFSRVLLKSIFCIWLNIDISHAIPSSYYLGLRQTMIEEEQRLAFGGNLSLEGDEVLANQCLMAVKRKEVDDAFENPLKFLPAKNFLDAREEIAQTEVFQILRKMPKGVLLHSHISTLVSLDYLIYNITYQPNLYACFNTTLQFHFFKTPSNDCNWLLLKDLRKIDSSIDEKIKNHLIMLHSGNEYIDVVWNEFTDIFEAIWGLITYRPMFEKYFYQAMQELYDDNIMAMEIRSSFSSLYEIDGTYHDKITVARIYQKVSRKFSREHPGFLGAKVIYSALRSVPQNQFDAQVVNFRKLKALYPNFVIGFDLVGQEDKGHTLLNFADKLQKLSKETVFFFHAGETNWYGQSTDENLIDAVLLNTKRIGHGFALPKHPKLTTIVKERNIAIEVSPISNQVLGLVKDMRNHPASNFFAENLPVVVSSDDPGFWGATGLSYDLYEAFIGIMSRDADLRALKQLTINSIVYSGLDTREQEKAFEILDKQWRKFVSNLATSTDCINRL